VNGNVHHEKKVTGFLIARCTLFSPRRLLGGASDPKPQTLPKPFLSQAAARRSIGISLQDARDRYAREDAAARVLQRTFGKNAMHIKFLRSAVAELTFERAVLGELYILIYPSPFFITRDKSHGISFPDKSRPVWMPEIHLALAIKTARFFQFLTMVGACNRGESGCGNRIHREERVSVPAVRVRSSPVGAEGARGVPNDGPQERGDVDGLC